jgi:hypothetical protein
VIKLPISTTALAGLQRDGWFVGRKCGLEEFARFKERLVESEGAPPSTAVLDFIEEFGNLVLCRPTRWEFQLTNWLPAVCPGGCVDWADLRSHAGQVDLLLNTVELNDVRKVVGHVFCLGRVTPECWPLLVDNSLRFFACDVCSDNVYLIADCASSFLDEIYRVSDPLSISGPLVGEVTWSNE